MKKPLILFVFLVSVGFIYFKYFNNPVKVVYVKEDTNKIEDTADIVEDVQTTLSEKANITVNGTVTGRLCYPSDFLPRGRIIAKNIETEEEFSQDYPGSFSGGGMNYTFDIPTGKYYLKYEAKPNPKTETAIFGYHTTTCPTGMERSCAQENKRVNIEVLVESEKTTEKIDLCDFYWGPTDEPRF